MKIALIKLLTTIKDSTIFNKLHIKPLSGVTNLSNLPLTHMKKTDDGETAKMMMDQ